MKNNFIAKTFQWLCIGLLVTFGLGYAITLNEQVIYALFSNYTIIIILEIAVGFIFSLMINKMSNTTAKILYLLYAGLSGVTFSTIFLVFEMSSILWVFLATAIIFGIFSFVGQKIKIDLSGFGTFLLIALLSMLILSIINIFLLNNALNMTISLVSILIFTGYIVFDMNRITRMNELNLDEKYAIFGAFQLYLDIINIIIDLLNLSGRKKD